MGHHNRHYAGDPHAHTGVWGSPTSAANFCEEDYAVTSLIAEFINCLSNLAYIYFALRYPRKTRPGTLWHQKLDFMAISLMGVGISSGIYHGTLRQTTQYLDDLSMFLLAGALLHPLYAANQTATVRALVSLILVAVIGGMSVVYVRSGNILIHTYTFIALLTFVWPRTIYLIHWTASRPPAEKRALMRRFWKAFWALGVGYALWHVDLELCWQLRGLREMVPMPLGWLLEMHGWWHFLTALGASHFIRLIRSVTDGVDGSAGKERKA
ncbi:dihydroceramidase [Sodiomyces alkalinus F11]|uniref:Dihydroceramidase n=1 Tax=Sodiomyces alkalinus (strain CBS 110278 / VKM F-3762 / F11) TaxID=1314773 RepID=A0A3N2PVC1_SODAK|nr:dihydroceramidase [Sodiomyces alkalinus F11]ROT38445.1 dihydroceramidase [Sodiomyces alkalinus F11]